MVQTLTATDAAQQARFDAVLQYDREQRSAIASIAFRGCGVSMYRLEQMHQSADAAKAKYLAAVDALIVHDEGPAFLAYRRAIMAAQA